MPSYAVAADKEKRAFLTRVHDPVHARGSAHACKLVYAHGPTRACSPTHAIAPALEFINDTLARPMKAPTTKKMGTKMLYTRNERSSYRGISASGSLARTPPASNGEIPYPLLDLEGRKPLFLWYGEGSWNHHSNKGRRVTLFVCAFTRRACSKISRNENLTHGLLIVDFKNGS